jgi:hypothetical protein
MSTRGYLGVFARLAYLLFIKVESPHLLQIPIIVRFIDPLGHKKKP